MMIWKIFDDEMRGKKQANKLLGCCPACVEYLEYAEPCVGINSNGVSFHPAHFPTWVSWKRSSSTLFQMLDYKGTESGGGHDDDYPLNFVEDTVELPCSSKVATSDNILREKRQQELNVRKVRTLGGRGGPFGGVFSF